MIIMALLMLIQSSTAQPNDPKCHRFNWDIHKTYMPGQRVSEWNVCAADGDATYLALKKSRGIDPRSKHGQEYWKFECWICGPPGNPLPSIPK